MRRLSAVLLFVAAGIGVHRLCVVPFLDNLVMRDVLERTALAEKVEPSRAVLLARVSLAELERIERSHRLDPSWYLAYGANCEYLQRWSDAANAYTRGLAVDQRPEIYFSRGLALLRLGRTDEAVGDMAMAVRFNPTFLDAIDGELRARVASIAALK